MFELEPPSIDDDDDGSSSSTSFLFFSIRDVAIPSEAVYTNNNCTIILNP